MKLEVSILSLVTVVPVVVRNTLKTIHAIWDADRTVCPPKKPFVEYRWLRLERQTRSSKYGLHQNWKVRVGHVPSLATLGQLEPAPRGRLGLRRV